MPDIFAVTQPTTITIETQDVALYRACETLQREGCFECCGVTWYIETMSYVVAHDQLSARVVAKAIVKIAQSC